MLTLSFFVLVGPAILLAMWAQWRVSAAYSQMSQVPARMSGFEAARRILDQAGLRHVDIEQVPGHLSDHFDPQSNVVRLSPEVYQGYSMAAVGIAAHEVGHAIQHARHYAPLAIRNLAVPAANFGSSFSQIILSIAIMLMFSGLTRLGAFAFLAAAVLFSGVVFFQIVNLPVEFDASSRAKKELVAMGIVSEREIGNVSKVLNAAAMTYVAATLQSLMTLLHYLYEYARMTERNA